MSTKGTLDDLAPAFGEPPSHPSVEAMLSGILASIAIVPLAGDGSERRRVTVTIDLDVATGHVTVTERVTGTEAVGKYASALRDAVKGVHDLLSANAAEDARQAANRLKRLRGE